MKRIILPVILGLILISSMVGFVIISSDDKNDSQSGNQITENNKDKGQSTGNKDENQTAENNKGDANMNQNDTEEGKLYIKVNNRTLAATLEKNTSTDAFLQKLAQNDVSIDMHDYGDFEKVGPLGFDLPRNDKQITTMPGDIILYQGNSITIYYDTNNWNFTKLGHIDNITQQELRDLLGDGNVTVTFSIEK